MANPTRIVAEVDFDREGKQQGFLRLPHSVHRSAYGWLAIPIVVIQNGPGPKVLLTAGNHGDEYEGQLALIKLCQELESADVRGRIIILPSANFPAAVAGLRTSPIDDLNLNRSFPGDPDGRPTSAIAHYIEAELLPRAEFLLDLHSGGSSLMYLPSTLALRSEDQELAAKQIEMLAAFAAPISCVIEGHDEDRTMLAAAQRAGIAALGTELGGAGTTTPHSLSVAELGVRRVLKWLKSVPDMEVAEPKASSRMMELCGLAYYVYSPDYGIWEPFVSLGDEVEAGQPAAAVYCQRTPWKEPVIARFQRAGTVICTRVPGTVERGDCLYHLVTDRSD